MLKPNVLKPRRGGVAGLPSWKVAQEKAIKAHESERKSRISPASAKNDRDAELAAAQGIVKDGINLDEIQLTESEIGELASELAEEMTAIF